MKENGIHLGMIKDKNKLDTSQSYSTLRKYQKLEAISEKLI